MMAGNRFERALYIFLDWCSTLWLPVLVMLIFIALMFASFHAGNQVMTMDKYCKTFDSVPLKYQDRVPDGCITQYFKNHKEAK